MSAEWAYLNARIMGNRELYVAGKFHPVHLGDVLHNRYSIFRKLGAGGQSTVWLARDMLSESRRYVAVKVFRSDSSEHEMMLKQNMTCNSNEAAAGHPGRHHVELALDSFVVDGPNGRHFCKVLEPLGCSLADVLEDALLKRAELNKPENWRGVAVEGDTWSASAAKQACWQILQGLDYLHSQQIAHQDIQPANICLALDYDLSAMSENEIQQDVWAEEEEEEPRAQPESASDDSSSSSSSSESSWHKARAHLNSLSDQKWSALPPGDPSAPPHSAPWNESNILSSRSSIELLHRRDGLPPSPTYTVCPTQLPCPITLNSTPKSKSRLVLIDLGFAALFPRCPLTPHKTLSDFRPPEALLDLPSSPTGKSDIFSLGLLFWEIVMLRRLVETSFYFSQDPDESMQKGRLLRDLAQRLGPVPAEIKGKWKGWERWVDEEGRALELEVLEPEEGPYEEGMFEVGDVWHQARQRVPVGMGEEEMGQFVEMVVGMLRWVPEERMTTGEVLGSAWFRDRREGNSRYQ